MKIAVIAWGSLIWNPDTLSTAGSWKNDGPRLPIEFARIARDGRVTLALCPPAKLVQTLWIYAASQELEEVIENLKERERTSSNNIGLVSLRSGRRRARFTKLVSRFEAWAATKSIDAVVWTDLEANFEQASGQKFTHENVINYLSQLRGRERDRAEEYVRRTPTQIDTLGRRGIERELGWFASERPD